MRFLFVLLLLASAVSAAPARSLSCTDITPPQLTHDGTAFQINAPMIDGANDVDAHIEVDGHPDLLNYRLIPSSTPGIYELPSSIPGYEQSPIAFHLTYMSDSGACDTVQYGTSNHPRATTTAPAAAPTSDPYETPASESAPYEAPASAPYQAQAPAPYQAPVSAPETAAASRETASCALPPIQHQVMRNDAGQYIVQVTSNEPYAYVDLHATVGSSPETNTRIGTNAATLQSSPMTIPAGDGLTYWLTYAKGDIACSTGMFETGPLN